MIGIDQSLPMGYDFVHYSIQSFDVQCILIAFILKQFQMYITFLISSFRLFPLELELCKIFQGVKKVTVTILQIE